MLPSMNDRPLSLHLLRPNTKWEAAHSLKTQKTGKGGIYSLVPGVVLYSKEDSCWEMRGRDVQVRGSVDIL